MFACNKNQSFHIHTPPPHGIGIFMICAHIEVSLTKDEIVRYHHVTTAVY